MTTTLTKLTQYAKIGAISIIFIWGITVLHELLHIVIAMATGGSIAPCATTGIPIGSHFTLGQLIQPHFYSCFYNGTPVGWNPLLAVFGTTLIGIFGIWFSRRIITAYIRTGTLIGSIIIWFQYALYGMSLIHWPEIGPNGAITYSRGDGYAILHYFGSWGYIPFAFALGLGIVVLYYRLKNSILMCYIPVPNPSAENIDFD